MKLDEEIEILLENYAALLAEYYAIQDKLMGEYETDFGIEDEPKYPIEYAELENKLADLSEKVKKMKEILKQKTQVNSVEIANDYSKYLVDENQKPYNIAVKKSENVQYLIIRNKKDIEDEIIIDVAKKIDKNSKRGLFDDEKVIDGVSYPIHSFLPQKYEKLFNLKLESNEDLTKSQKIL